MLWHYPYIDHQVCRLHEFISVFVESVIREGTPPRSFRITTHCGPELRALATRSSVLKKKLKKFYEVTTALTPTDKAVVFDAFQTINAVDRQLGKTTKRWGLSDLPFHIRVPGEDLFRFLYSDTLRLDGAIEDHWRQFYARLESKDCPFCAIEPLHHPDFYKQDYDHLLCKDIYPFAAVNLRNLVPMGRDCNSIFKKTKDLILKGTTRRRAFLPFLPSGVKITVSLDGSALPTSGNRKGKWKVRVLPNQQEVATWKDVFETPLRYQKEIFEAKSVGWIADFRNLAEKEKPTTGWNVTKLRGCLSKYAQSFEPAEYRDHHFLKSAFYGYLARLETRAFLKPMIRSLAV